MSVPNGPVNSVRIAARRKPAGLFAFLVMCLLVLSTSGGRAQIHPTLADSLFTDRIVFEGNKAFSAGTLQELMETRQTPGAIPRFLYSISERLPFSAEPIYFDYDLFQQDLENIRLFYRNNGFFSARIDGRYETMESRRAVTLFIQFDEGSPAFVDSVAYRNIARLPEEVRDNIAAEPVLLSGRRYSADNVQAEVARVRGILVNGGYPRAYSDSVVVERKRSNGNVIIHLPFYYGRRLYFGELKITISGDDELNLARKIIVDRLDFLQGDVYSNAKRERAEANLNRLGLFAGVQLTPEIPDMQDTVHQDVPMTLTLTTRKKHELAPGVLVNNLYGRLNGGAEITYLLRNIFGGAQNFSTKLDFVGKIPQFYTAFNATSQIRLDQPYLIDNITSGSWKISYVLAKEEGLYDGNIFQNVISVSRLFGERVVGSMDWTLEQSKYSSIRGSLVNTPFAFFDTTGIDYRNSIILLSLERDYTNDFFLPTRGWYIKGTFEEAGVLKNVLPRAFQGFQSTEYYKGELLYRYFTDASRNQTSIVGFKLKIGAIFRYGESREKNIPVPFNRRYYAGGATSIRGWTSRELSVSGSELAAFGSNALVETSIEYRWQLFPKAKKWLALEPERFWMVFFADAGNLWNEPLSVRLSETAMAFGIGLRYNLFFGPIRIDYGMRGHDPLSEQPWFVSKRFWPEVFAKGIIQLGIGHAF